MKNFDVSIYGVEDISAVEMQKTNGGIAFLAAIAIGVAIAAVTEIISDWDNFKAGLAGEKEIKTKF